MTTVYSAPATASVPVAEFARYTSAELKQCLSTWENADHRADNPVRPACHVGIDIGLFFDGTTNNKMKRDRRLLP